MKHLNKRRCLYLFLCGILVWVFVMLIWIPTPLFKSDYSTVIYSCEGDLMGARVAHDAQWRFPESDSIPEKFKKSIVCFEDKRFYRHLGIDFIAIVRSIRNNIVGSNRQGASTLTMQVARMAREGKSRNLWQKFVEMNWATWIELTHSKESIMALYANHAPFGGNVVGLEAASWRYFGTDCHNLSWAECATLAVLPNSPALIHPGKNRTRLLNKRNRLLEALYAGGYIDKEEMELAKEEPLPDKPLPLPNSAPHLLEKLKKRYEGQSIHTTVNYSLQEEVQRMANMYSRQYAANLVNNMAIVVADVETGDVKAYVGNVMRNQGDRKDSASCYMVDAADAPRSTGSILKPFLYAAMISDGDLMPEELQPDVPMNLRGFCPTNYNKNNYGAVSAREAVRRSLNVPLVHMLTTYNIGRFMSKMKALGMNTLHYNEDHYGATIILGGAEGTLLNMCGMYASCARTLNHYRPYGSQYNPSDIHELRFIHEKEDTITGIFDSRLKCEGLLSASGIWFAFDAMSDVNRPEEESDWQQFASMKRIAWKTGTSYGSRDAWAIGVTPKYVVGVWVGNATGEGRPEITGVGYAAPVLFHVFSQLHGSEWFYKPLDDLRPMKMCTKSGLPASDICGDTATQLMPAQAINITPCHYHKLVHLNKEGTFQVNSSCYPASDIVTKPWFVLPPAMAYYYKQHSANYEELPRMHPDCATERSPLEILYPTPNSTLFLPKLFANKENYFVFRATHSDQSATLYWHLDKQFLGSTSFLAHSISCKAGKGLHYLTVVDDKGVSQTVKFTVK
ncbi:MAG: penicillin-binding protein 1C [Paludibacteraceae bacterium]|nr:penicillin-binding protein 1C [Paludibacteraceae bacterium]